MKLDEADGSIGLNGYLITAYSGDLGTVGTSDVAVDRDGDAYFASWYSAAATPLQYKGVVLKLDLATKTIIDQQNYGAAGDGFTYTVIGVDLITTAPTARVVYGGDVTNPAQVAPPLLGCDITYNGGVADGVVASSTQ